MRRLQGGSSRCLCEEESTWPSCQSSEGLQILNRLCSQEIEDQGNGEEDDKQSSIGLESRNGK